MHRVKPHKKKQRHFLIMSSVFYTDKYIHQVFDLKGSTQGRAATAKEVRSGNPVYKDNDFTAMHAQLRLTAFKARQVQEQLARDVEFLRQLSIMDYSLLLGIHYKDRPTPGEGRSSGVHEMEMTRSSGAGSRGDREDAAAAGKVDGEKAFTRTLAPTAASGGGASSAASTVAGRSAAVREGGGRADGEGEADGDDGWRRHHFDDLLLPPHHPSASSSSAQPSLASSSSSSSSSSFAPPLSSSRLSGPVLDSLSRPVTTQAQAEAIVAQSSPAPPLPPRPSAAPTISSDAAPPDVALPSPLSSTALDAAAASSPLSSEGEAPRWHIQADDSPGHADDSSDDEQVVVQHAKLPLHLEQLHLHIEDDERGDGQPHAPIVSVVHSPPSTQQRALQPSFSSTTPLPSVSADLHQRPSASTSTSPLPPALVVREDHPHSSSSSSHAAVPQSEAELQSAPAAALPSHLTPIRSSSHSVPQLLTVPLTPAALASSSAGLLPPSQSSSHSPTAAGPSSPATSVPSSPHPDYAKRQSTYGLPKVHPRTSHHSSCSSSSSPPRALRYYPCWLLIPCLSPCCVRVRVCVLCVVMCVS